MAKNKIPGCVDPQEGENGSKAIIDHVQALMSLDKVNEPAIQALFPTVSRWRSSSYRDRKYSLKLPCGNYFVFNAKKKSGAPRRVTSYKLNCPHAGKFSYVP
jgi:hypothetical protein